MISSLEALATQFASFPAAEGAIDGSEGSTPGPESDLLPRLADVPDARAPDALALPQPKAAGLVDLPCLQEVDTPSLRRMFSSAPSKLQRSQAKPRLKRHLESDEHMARARAHRSTKEMIALRALGRFWNRGVLQRGNKVFLEDNKRGRLRQQLSKVKKQGRLKSWDPLAVQLAASVA